MQWRHDDDNVWCAHTRRRGPRDLKQRRRVMSDWSFFPQVCCGVLVHGTVAPAVAQQGRVHACSARLWDLMQAGYGTRI